jgi:hypothetical protein
VKKYLGYANSIIIESELFLDLEEVLGGQVDENVQLSHLCKLALPRFNGVGVFLLVP